MPVRGAKATPFSRKLALNRWLLGLFGCTSLDDLAGHLKGDELGGLDTDNVHRFHAALCLHAPAARRPELPDDRCWRRTNGSSP